MLSDDKISGKEKDQKEDGVSTLGNIRDTTTLLGRAYKANVGESFPGLKPLTSTLRLGTEHAQCVEQDPANAILCTAQNILVGELTGKVPILSHPSVNIAITLSRIYNRNVSEIQSRLRSFDVEMAEIEQHYKQCINEASGNFEEFLCRLQEILELSITSQQRKHEIHTRAFDQSLRLLDKKHSSILSELKHKKG
jgi:hypothetical protein